MTDIDSRVTSVTSKVNSLPIEAFTVAGGQTVHIPAGAYSQFIVIGLIQNAGNTALFISVNNGATYVNNLLDGSVATNPILSFTYFPSTHTLGIYAPSSNTFNGILISSIV